MINHEATIGRSRVKIQDLLIQDEWWIVDTFNNWTEALVGTGATTTGVRQLRVDSGGTNGGTALRRSGTNIGWSAGKNRAVLDWSKKIVIHAFIVQIASTTNGLARLSFGKGTADGVGVLVDKAIGIILEDDAIKGLVHNGSDAATVDLSTTLTANIVSRVTIVSDGAGNVEWFLNGVSKGTSSAGPTGNSGSNEVLLQMETDNGADSASHHLQMNSLKIFVEQ